MMRDCTLLVLTNRPTQKQTHFKHLRSRILFFRVDIFIMQVAPPKSLEELLSVMAVKDKITIVTVDQAITSNPWANKFRAYLRRMKLEDDENILKFLVLVQVM